MYEFDMSARSNLAFDRDARTPVSVVTNTSARDQTHTSAQFLVSTMHGRYKMDASRRCSADDDRDVYCRPSSLCQIPPSPTKEALLPIHFGMSSWSLELPPVHAGDSGLCSTHSTKWHIWHFSAAEQINFRSNCAVLSPNCRLHQRFDSSHAQRRRLRNQELLTKYYSSDQTKRNQMGGAYDSCGGKQRCIQRFDGETREKQTACKTWAWMGGLYSKESSRSGMGWGGGVRGVDRSGSG
jgi:hypothetical protein